MVVVNVNLGCIVYVVMLVSSPATPECECVNEHAPEVNKVLN